MNQPGNEQRRLRRLARKSGPATPVYYLVSFTLVVVLDILLGSAYTVWLDGAPSRYASSPIYHHDLIENFSDPEHRYFTNSLGMRDASCREVHPAVAGERRLLFIGDSGTEAAALPYEETFAGRVSSALKGRGVEVLNAAMFSYSPVIYLNKLQYLLNVRRVEIHEVAVFLDISDIGDEAEVYEIRDGVVAIREGGPEAMGLTTEGWNRTWAALERHSVAARLLFLAVGRSGKWVTWAEHHPRTWTPERDPVMWRRVAWTIDPALLESVGRPGLELARQHLSELAQVLRERGIRMTLVVYPWPLQIDHRDLESVQVVFWREWAEAEGVDFLNLFPLFIDDQPPGQAYEKYFTPRDFHWNALGHRMVAEAFLQFRERHSAAR